MNYVQVKEKTLEHFNELLLKNPDNDCGMVGYSRCSNMKRYRKLLEIGDFNGKTVLDIGCGIGGFYDFLKEQGVICEYIGLDINPNMVNEAKNRHPDVHNIFSVCDIMEENLDKKFDYVVSNGPLNIKYTSSLNIDITMRLIQRMYMLSNVGMAITMTSSLTRKPNDKTFYYNPLELLEKIFSFCANVRFDHTYLPHDFVVFCYHKDLYDL